MSSVYGEPADVRARDDGRPMRFVWRSRRYTVCAILEHWVVNREWWRTPGAPGTPDASGTPDGPGTPGGAGRPGPGLPELEFWRIEAAPGQGMTPGVFELRRDVATGAWTLRHWAVLPGPCYPDCVTRAALPGPRYPARPSRCSMYRNAELRTVSQAPERSTGVHQPP